MSTTALRHHLEAALAGEESYFRQALMREDLARLDRLEASAASAADRTAFLKEAVYFGWTVNDMRTHELREVLDPFLVAFHAASQSADDHGDLIPLWLTLDHLRMDRIVGCLTRVPRVE